MLCMMIRDVYLYRCSSRIIVMFDDWWCAGRQTVRAHTHMHIYIFILLCTYIQVSSDSRSAHFKNVSMSK